MIIPPEGRFHPRLKPGGYAAPLAPLMPKGIKRLKSFKLIFDKIKVKEVPMPHGRY
jgi:hypothetical protein